MKLICGICEIDDGETLHVYDARSGNPVHAMAITADGETTHVLPINSGDCIVIVPHAAMRVDPAPLAETAPLATVETAPLATVENS